MHLNIEDMRSQNARTQCRNDISACVYLVSVVLSIADDITILPKDYRYLLGRVSAVDFDQCGDF